MDCADSSRFAEARHALQRLLEDPVVGSMPLLVLANKVDLLSPAERATQEVRGWAALVQELNLDCASDGHSGQRWSVLSVSATRRINLEKIVRWLVLQAHGAGDEAVNGESDATPYDEGSGVTGRLWRVWDALSSTWSRGRRKATRWGGKRSFTMLADASRSMLVDD